MLNLKAKIPCLLIYLMSWKFRLLSIFKINYKDLLSILILIMVLSIYVFILKDPMISKLSILHSLNKYKEALLKWTLFLSLMVDLFIYTLFLLNLLPLFIISNPTLPWLLMLLLNLILLWKLSFFLILLLILLIFILWHLCIIFSHFLHSPLLATMP